jgi:hypothetical protein
MAIRVDLEIRPAAGNNNFFFVLDDATQGILQETAVEGSYDFVLGGPIMVDVTEYVRSISITRGKSRETDSFQTGLANIVFNNHNRYFDPLYTASPLYTYVVPKRGIRISTENLGSLTVLYFGIISDWNLEYDISGDAIASAAAADALSLFATQSYSGGLQTEELSSVRIEKVLDELTWPIFIPTNYADQDTQKVFTGSQTLGADTVEEGTSALQYLQLIERSEPGKFYVDSVGRPTFLGRNTGRSIGGFVYTDDGSGIDYTAIEVQYGSEFLFNETIISSAITAGTASAVDLNSQDLYGISSLVRQDLLMSTDSAALDMAIALTAKYSEPEFRFSALTFIGSEPDVGAPDLNELVQVKFTPNGIGDPIERYAEVIGIQYEITPSVAVTTINLETVSNTSWTLDDLVFGRLSAGNTLAY